MSNQTDQFSDADIEQGIRNFEAVSNLCRLMKEGLPSGDPMRAHFAAVIKFCNQSAEGSRKLLSDSRIEIVKS